MLTNTQGFKLPYYAVIFTSELQEDQGGYEEEAGRIAQLAQSQPGFLGIESARDQASGITVSYWADAPSIAQWKEQVEHLRAQELGRSKWYRRYHVQVAKVERSYGMDD